MTKSKIFRPSAKTFVAMVEGAEDAFIVIDSDQRICFVNPRGGSMFGYDPDELTGAPERPTIVSIETCSPLEPLTRPPSRKVMPSSLQPRHSAARRRSCCFAS